MKFKNLAVVSFLLSCGVVVNQKVFLPKSVCASEKKLDNDVYIKCEVNYSNNSFSISSSKYNFKIFDLKLYSIYDENEFRYIAGDVINCNQSGKIICFTIFKECGTNICNIQYYDAQENNVYNLNSYIDDELFKLIKKDSTHLNLNDDDVSKRIVYSQQQYKAFNSNEIHSVKRSNGAYLDKTLEPGKYDSYTDNDGIIHQYESLYMEEEQANMKKYENRIIDIVPRELFSQIGSYLYIGKEYGFYINTGYDNIIYNDYCSDVFVFDISNTSPMEFSKDGSSYKARNYGTISITPLFQRRYATRYKENNPNFSSFFNTNNDSIVISHTNYDASNYYLADIKMDLILENENQSNTNDTDYNINNDKGSFFTNQTLRSYACSYNPAPNYSEPPTVDASKIIINYALGFIPYAGPAYSGFVTVHDIISTFRKSTNTSIKSNPFNFECNYYPTSPAEQISQYGNYCRAISFECASENASVLFSNRENSYFSFDYQISDIINDSGNINRLFAKISSSIYGPDFCPNIPASSPRKRNSFTSEYLYEEFCNSYKNLNNGENIVNLIKSGAEIFRFMPSQSKEYFFDTTGNLDTQMYLYNDKLKLLAFDDNSGKNKNSKISYMLQKGTYYFIKVKLSNVEEYGTFSLNLRNIEQIYAGATKTFYINNGSEKLFEFIPSTSKKYIFDTDGGGDLDPEMFIYDNLFNEIAYNDDSDDDVFPYISIYLNANNTYYILIRMIGDEYSGDVTLCVS